MPQETPLLSVVVVVGPLRARGQRVLDAVGAQTIADRLQLVVVDLRGATEPWLTVAPHLRADYIVEDPALTYGAARAAGVSAARAPVVAFVEDHCFPLPDWAEAVVRAHDGPWVGVGYAFTNANPETYRSRSGLLADYGLWAHPARHGPARLLPGNNIAYKRTLLDAFGDDLPTMLGTDFAVHQHCLRHGLPMGIAADALAAHTNFESLGSLLRANYAYCRTIAATRVRVHGWSPLRRLVYGLAVPLGAPAIKLARLFASLRGRRALWGGVAAALPVVAVTFAWSAVGEAVGYLFGMGDSAPVFRYWELEAPRLAQPEPAVRA